MRRSILSSRTTTRSCFGFFSSKKRRRYLRVRPGVENVLDHDDGLAFDADVQILDQFHFTSGVGAVTRNSRRTGNRRRPRRQVSRARSVRKKHGTFQNADQMKRFGRKILANFLARVASAGSERAHRKSETRQIPRVEVPAFSSLACCMLLDHAWCSSCESIPPSRQ